MCVLVLVFTLSRACVCMCVFVLRACSCVFLCALVARVLPKGLVGGCLQIALSVKVILQI